MMNQKPVPILVNTLSVRLDQTTYFRLLTAARYQRRRLSDYVRLLLERIDQESERAPSRLRNEER
jgi:hypothetical protein